MIDEEYLNKRLESINVIYSNYSFFRDVDTALTKDRLEGIQEMGDLPKARMLNGNDNRYHLDRTDMAGLEKMVGEELNLVVESTGFFWYPYKGYCGWPPNSDNVGERVYLVWAQDNERSFFRYQDQESNEIVTNWDKQGWQIKRFTISKEKPLWHCVGSHTNRVSIGFKVLGKENNTVTGTGK